MPVVVAVLLIGAMVTVVMSVLSRRRFPVDTLDPERAERWVVRSAPARYQPVLRRLDRRVSGGVGVLLAFAAVFAGAVVVGSLFDTIGTGGGFARWDESAAEWGAAHGGDGSVTLLRTITHLGGTWLLAPLLALLAAFDYARRRNFGAGLYLAAVGFGIILLNNGLKLMVDRQRPDVARLAGWSGSSFPSGHAAASAACWAALALVVGRHLRARRRGLAAVPAVVVAVAVATSRVLLGVHWLTDVLAGLVVGWTWFFLVSLLFGGRLLRLGEPLERVAEGRDSPSREAVGQA